MPREQQREAQSSDLLSAFDFRWEKGRRSGALQEIELGGCSRINDVWIEDRRKKEKKKTLKKAKRLNEKGIKLINKIKNPQQTIGACFQVTEKA